jgi:glucokinase
MTALILAGDVGGTKTELRLLTLDGTLLHRNRFESGSAESLEQLVGRFLSEPEAAAHPRPAAAAFGIAGPVMNDVCIATNLPWRIDARAVERALQIPAVRLLNDFEATAYGVVGLAPDALHTLQAGERDPHGNIAVIGAGTGLGEAIVTWVADGGGRWQVIASEGGHADFAPRSDDEIELYRHLRGRFGHVSWERVVSGLGIANVYRFLRERGDAGSAAVEAEFDAAGEHHAGGVVGAHALAGDDPRSVKAIDLFLASYGAEAGNLALKCNARGGVYLTGGIAPKLLRLVESGGFLRALRDKGRLSRIVEGAPVHVVLDENVPVRGAIAVAASLVARP